MSFPSRFPGRCSRCGGAIPTGALIDYDKATKTAWHPTCPVQEALPMEGREPALAGTTLSDDEVRAMVTGLDLPERERSALLSRALGSGQKAGKRGRANKAAGVESNHVCIVTCFRCGGSSRDRKVIHVECIDQDDPVPF